MTTALLYMYRDGSNFKQKGRVVFADDLDTATCDRLRSRLAALCDSTAGDAQFVPQDVGLAALQTGFTGFLNPDDHPWHDLGRLEPCDLPSDSPCTLDELVLRFEAAAERGWPSSQLDEHDLARRFGTFVCTYGDDGEALDPDGRTVS